jgi:hypothetical protein
VEGLKKTIENLLRNAGNGQRFELGPPEYGGVLHTGLRRTVTRSNIYLTSEMGTALLNKT